jgi:endonuclease YncB( thermonuclease family)
MKKILPILIVLVGLTLYQGDLSWLSRPDASWRQATDILNDLVPAEGTPGTFNINGRVVRVADGDTISVLDANNDQHKIRLHGIDAPERDQPHGKAASRALSSMVADKIVGIAVKDTDDYGRTVGVVYLDGVNINLEMVKAGHAWWYSHYSGRDRDLSTAEQQARQAKLGLWADADTVAPWDWRRGRR